jgi:glucosamine kinase
MSAWIRPRMTRVLGVDGGQSGIRSRHSSGDRVVEVEGVSRLEGDTVAAVADAVARAWDEAGFDVVDRAVLGLTTAPTDVDSRERLCALVGLATDAAEVWLADDAVTTHAGALSLGWGVSVVAGTGVACLAVPEQGDARLIGGHGYLLGDEGGAFWIGREGLRAVLRAADGRGPATALAASAARRFDGLTDLGDRLHSARRPVNDIAQFAPEVLAIADDGDALAGTITEDAVTELVLLIRAGVAAAGAPEPGVRQSLVPVALGGRLLGEGTPLRRRLDRRLGAELPCVEARSADASPLEGAISLGSAAGPGRYRDLVYIWRPPVAT